MGVEPGGVGVIVGVGCGVGVAGGGEVGNGVPLLLVTGASPKAAGSEGRIRLEGAEATPLVVRRPSGSTSTKLTTATPQNRQPTARTETSPAATQRMRDRR